MYKIHVGSDVNKEWSWCVLSNRIPILHSRKYSCKANAQRAADEFRDRINGKIKLSRETEGAVCGH